MTIQEVAIVGTIFSTVSAALTTWYLGRKKARVDETGTLVNGYKNLNEQYKTENSDLVTEIRQLAAAVKEECEKNESLRSEVEKCKTELLHIGEQYGQLNGQYHVLLDYYKELVDKR